MTTTAKGQKDKLLNSSPRLVPRPTAASAARAARNATNRNLTSTSFVRQSPTRTPTSPKMQRNSDLHSASYKGESKADIKISSKPAGEPEIKKPLEERTPLEEPTTFNVEDQSTILKEETSAEHGPESDFNPFGTIAIDLINSEGDHQQQQQEQHENSEEGDLLGNTDPVSRPLTPGSNKDLDNLRPLTPKSRQSSRPDTPRAPSRPTTPAHPRNTTPNTTPRLTPQRVHTPSLPREGRPKTPSMQSVPPSTRVMTPNTTSSVASQPLNEDDVRVVYMKKQKQFHRLKKELDLKQQMILEEFDQLRALQERMSHEGGSDCGEGLLLQELVVFNVADWTAEEVAQLCKDAAAASDTDVAVEYIANAPPIDEGALADLDSIVLNVPVQFADLCLQAFNTRQEIIEWVKKYLENNENGGGECLEQIDRYNTQGLDLCESLSELKSRSQDAVGTMSKFAKRALQERRALVSVGETLVREIAKLRQDMETHSNDMKELQDALQETDHHKVLVEIRRELEGERAARNIAINKLATAESQLRQSRLRISKMDRQLREAEASMASLTGTVKTLEDQSRQKEVQLEARARKLKESLKAGELTSTHIAQQRDTLQAEIQDLKQQIETLNAQHKTQVQELSNQLKKANNHFEDQTMVNQKLSEHKEATEAALIEAQSNIEALTAKVEELERNRPNPNLPTEREMDLWAELQSIKDILRTTEDEVKACKREKVRFLETLTNITESDNKIELQQKLAAELLSKEEIICKMQSQIRELCKGIKLNEQKVVQYEQYVRDLQAHTRVVTTCDDPSTNANVLGYEEEIMNLKMGLLEAEHRNDELSEKLAHKEQQIEQQDKTSRAQARVIKVREELINMLKNKETEQSRELSALQQDLEHRMKIVDEVNKQIAAKADEIQELFATLENKQQQIHRLEKIVLALEEQQRRAQAQRTRHEEKIAALEHELAANGRKERKFVFF